MRKPSPSRREMLPAVPWLMPLAFMRRQVSTMARRCARSSWLMIISWRELRTASGRDRPARASRRSIGGGASVRGSGGRFASRGWPAAPRRQRRRSDSSSTRTRASWVEGAHQGREQRLAHERPVEHDRPGREPVEAAIGLQRRRQDREREAHVWLLSQRPAQFTPPRRAGKQAIIVAERRERHRAGLDELRQQLRPGRTSSGTRDRRERPPAHGEDAGQRSPERIGVAAQTGALDVEVGAGTVAQRDDPGAGRHDGHVGEPGRLIAVKVGGRIVDAVDDAHAFRKPRPSRDLRPQWTERRPRGP